jgi:ribosomal protein S18 acetylase RimI-like enzyme
MRIFFRKNISNKNQLKTSLTFRNAVPADAESLSAFINRAYRGDTARAGWTHEADLVAGMRTTTEDLLTTMNSPGEYFLLTYIGKKLAASMHVKDEGTGYFIGMLAVSPGLQSQKVGSTVLAEIEARAKKAGRTSIRFSVLHVRTELIAYYERLGFALTGDWEEFPERYIPKVPGLRLVEMKKTV